eukprot:302597-Alexandrium_andersonii.AAC.1
MAREAIRGNGGLEYGIMHRLWAKMAEGMLFWPGGRGPWGSGRGMCFTRPTSARKPFAHSARR